MIKRTQVQPRFVRFFGGGRRYHIVSVVSMDLWKYRRLRRRNGQNILVCILAAGCATTGTTVNPTRSSPPVIPSNVPAAQRDRIAAVQPIVFAAAQQHALDPSLINGVIWVESRFDPRARSSVGARGLMQLMPATASSLAQSMNRRARSYDPAFNIEAGSLYLARLIDRYDGNVQFALAAYNAGAGNVDRWLNNDGILAKHGRDYARKVLTAQKMFRRGRVASSNRVASRHPQASPSRGSHPPTNRGAAPSPAPTRATRRPQTNAQRTAVTAHRRELPNPSSLKDTDTTRTATPPRAGVGVLPSVLE